MQVRRVHDAYRLFYYYESRRPPAIYDLSNNDWILPLRQQYLSMNKLHHQVDRFNKC